MASNTPKLNLLKKNPATDGNETFNIKTMLNDNWDKIDVAVGDLQEAVQDIHVPNATLAQAGIVQLSNATNGTRENVAATEKAVKMVNDSVNVHLADIAILNPITGSTENAIFLNFTAAQNKKGSFKATVNNTANVTINNIPFLKLDGNQIASGGIKSGKVYDFYYDEASGGRFFILAKASGNAAAGDVLAGKTFSSDDGEFTGTMPNRGAGRTVTPVTTDQIKEAGYYSSDITIKGDSNLLPANIVQGKTIFGVTGKASNRYRFPSSEIEIPPNSVLNVPLPFTPITYFITVRHFAFVAPIYTKIFSSESYFSIDQSSGSAKIDIFHSSNSLIIKNNESELMKIIEGVAYAV
ncbi:tail fiber protein [Paenibacillus segetis]|uniref:Uncharacterized protein n=1 Tax=Paenibacillus segetis TaxID=1325360 RepID=A0ABQ1YLH2_9BACL|nr:phage tail protein [Paenibacillus segetis]GGH28529.1 hypothetical protein GCM10008013_30610 [Paenibacillus segetis]